MTSQKGTSMEEEQKKTTTPTELDEMERQQKEINQILQNCQSGSYQAVLWRIQPKWCEGYLDDFEVDPAAGIDLGHIRQLWGGHVIQMKIRNSKGEFAGGTNLNFKSWPPKRFGKLINRYEEYFEYDKPLGNVPGRQPKNAPPNPYTANPALAPPQQFDPNKLMDTMVKMFGDMQKTVAKSTPAPLLDGVKAIPTDPFGQMMSGLKMYKEMQKIFGEGDKMISQNMGDDESNLFGSIAQIVSMMMNRQQAPQPPAQLAPPAQSRGPAPAVRNDTAPLQGPVRQQAAPDLPGMIASLTPQQIGDIIVSAASRMEPDAREEAFAEVATRLAGLDGVEYEDDDLSREPEETLDDPTTPPTISDPD